MSVVTRNVYRQLLNVVRTAQAAGIPLTGCVALPDFTHVLCPAHYISTHFRHSQDLDGEAPGWLLGGWIACVFVWSFTVWVRRTPQPSHAIATNQLLPTIASSHNHTHPLTLLCHTPPAADAFLALRVLPKQLAVLQACEEESRQVRWGDNQNWCSITSCTQPQLFPESSCAEGCQPTSCFFPIPLSCPSLSCCLAVLLCCAATNNNRPFSSGATCSSTGASTAR